MKRELSYGACPLSRCPYARCPFWYHDASLLIPLVLHVYIICATYTWICSGALCPAWNRINVASVASGEKSAQRRGVIRKNQKILSLLCTYVCIFVQRNILPTVCTTRFALIRGQMTYPKHHARPVLHSGLLSLSLHLSLLHGCIFIILTRTRKKEE